MTSKEYILSEMKQKKRELQNFGIVRIGLFGSYVREEQSEKSDIDILLEFEPEKENFDNYMSVYDILENLFRNEKVEIVTKNGLSPYIGPQILKEVIGSIRLALAHHKQLQKLSQLETTVSSEAQKKIHRGNLLLELLKQDKHTNIKWEEQVVLFYTVEQGFFDDIVKEKWKNFEKLLLELVRNRYADILKIIKNNIFDYKVKTKIQEIVKDFKQEFLLADK